MLKRYSTICLQVFYDGYLSGELKYEIFVSLAHVNAAIKLTLFSIHVCMVSHFGVELG